MGCLAQALQLRMWYCGASRGVSRVTSIRSVCSSSFPLRGSPKMAPANMNTSNLSLNVGVLCPNPSTAWPLPGSPSGLRAHRAGTMVPLWLSHRHGAGPHLASHSRAGSSARCGAPPRCARQARPGTAGCLPDRHPPPATIIPVSITHHHLILRLV